MAKYFPRNCSSIDRIERSRGFRHLAGAHVTLSRLIGIRSKFARAGHEPRTMRLLGWRHHSLIGIRPRDNRNFTRFGTSFVSSL
jgi:hypothetical protein